MSALLHQHSQYRVDITNLLHEGYSELRSTTDLVVEKIKELELSREECHLRSSPVQDKEFNESECRDVHVSTDSDPASITKACSC